MMTVIPRPPAKTTMVRDVDPLDSTLAYAALLLDAQACVLDVSPQQGAPDGITLGWGMTQADTALLIAWLRVQLGSRSDDDAAVLSVPVEQWPASVRRLGGSNDGELVALPLIDQGNNLGWLGLLGRPGTMQRPPLDLPRTRAAFVGQVATQLRTALETRALREQRDQLESIFRFSGDGILTVDATLRITGCNPALEQLTGWDANAIIGKFYLDVLRLEDHHGAALGLTRCPLLEAFATGTPIMREVVIHARDGQAIDVAVTASAVRSPEGLPTSGVLNVRDVSRTRENEMLSSTIVSVVSHELQTPIAIIKGYASTLSRPDAIWSGEALRQRLHSIEEEADRLSHMVANLLYASRIQAGGLSMQPALIEIGAVLASTVRRFQARSPRHALRLRMPANFPAVIADRERIEEVVANLLDNAIKYSRPGSAVVVEGRFTSADVIISVSDSGDGIPLREQQRVFARFQRVEGDLTRKTTGAGLGLYICQAIVSAHGGQIWVESEVGHGSTFAFGLPRAERAAVPMVIIPTDGDR